MQGDAVCQTGHASDVNTTEMYIDKTVSRIQDAFMMSINSLNRDMPSSATADQLKIETISDQVKALEHSMNEKIKSLSKTVSDVIEAVKSNNNNNKYEIGQMHFKEEIKFMSKSVMDTNIKVEQKLEKMSQQMSDVLEPKITYACKTQNRFELLAQSESQGSTSQNQE